VDCIKDDNGNNAEANEMLKIKDPDAWVSASTKAQQNNSKPSLPINKTPRKPLTSAFLSVEKQKRRSKQGIHSHPSKRSPARKSPTPFKHSNQHTPTFSHITKKRKHTLGNEGGRVRELSSLSGESQRTSKPKQSERIKSKSSTLKPEDPFG
jgi:hypothetical protein